MEFIFQARFHEKAHADLGTDFITVMYTIRSCQPLIINSIPEHYPCHFVVRAVSWEGKARARGANEGLARQASYSGWAENSQSSYSLGGDHQTPPAAGNARRTRTLSNSVACKLNMKAQNELSCSQR